MAEQWAYGDESGAHQDAKFYLLLGYVATRDICLQFKDKWSRVIKSAGVSEFHAKWFFNNSPSSKNPYRGWTIAQKEAHLEALLAIIAEHELTPAGRAIDMEAFWALRHDERRHFTGGSLQTRVTLTAVDRSDPTNPVSKVDYNRRFITSGAPTQAYMAAFNLFHDHLQRITREDAVIHVVLDRKRELEAGARQLFDSRWADSNRRRFADITFADSADEPGLQAADLYAFVVGARGGTSASLTRRAWDYLKPDVDIAGSEYFHFYFAELRKLISESPIIPTAAIDQLEQRVFGISDPRLS